MTQTQVTININNEEHRDTLLVLLRHRVRRIDDILPELDAARKIAGPEGIHEISKVIKDCLQEERDLTETINQIAEQTR